MMFFNKTVQTFCYSSFSLVFSNDMIMLQEDRANVTRSAKSIFNVDLQALMLNKCYGSTSVEKSMLN